MENSSVAGPTKLAAHSMLTLFMSHYDANALLNMYPLHMLSHPQIAELLQAAGAPSKFSTALDIGTGDGKMATDLLGPMAETIFATETSKHMARKAVERGINCSNVDISSSDPPHLEHGTFDFAMLLNVLDRTSKPKTILERIAHYLKPEAYCVIASPLPFRPIVFEGAVRRLPQETFRGAPSISADWDDSAQWLIETVLGSVPQLEPRVVSRIPYISGGDLAQPFVVYDDAVIVLQRRPEK